jgi:outer membrane immunogenic protein
MRRFQCALLAAVAVIGFASVASAADMPVKAPAYIAPYNWTGWYGGANVGYGFGTNTINYGPLDPFSASFSRFVSPQLADDPKGFLGGLQLGANKQVGNIVYGVETDISYSQIRDSVSGPLIISTFVTSGQQKLDWFGTLRARLGIVMLDRSLIYATGGLAYGRATLSANTIDNVSVGGCASISNFCTIGSAERWMAGWTIGGGWEYAFASNWSAKFEYLYYDLGSISATMPDPNGLAITFQGSTDVKGNIVRAGLNYKFGM